MLRKSCFYQYKEITREIEKAIYRQKGIEEVIVETAVESDEAGSSGEEIFAMVKEEALRLTRAKDVKLISRVIPDLLGGIRLRWGSIVIDGSIKQRLEKMAGDIGALNGYLEQGLEA
jgi:F-type H+-transporting ATPase subunit delta